MIRPTRILATLFALSGGAAALTGPASAQTYHAPPAHHVPTTTYGSTFHAPVYAPPATIAGALTRPRGGQVLHRPAPVPSSAQTIVIDGGVTYAPYHGTPQPVYRQPAPVYSAPQPVRTWVNPPQPVYAPAPSYTGPQFGAPAIIGGLVGAAILGAILLDDDDDDRHRHRGHDRRGDRQDGLRRQDRRGGERGGGRRQDRGERVRAEPVAVDRQRARDGERGQGRDGRPRGERQRGGDRGDMTRAERQRLRAERRARRN